jgi:hypothetical protein
MADLNLIAQIAAVINMIVLVLILIVIRTDKPKYIEHLSLQWNEEDFDSLVKTYLRNHPGMLDWSDEDKRMIVKDALDASANDVIKLINDSILNQIKNN